MNILVTGGCGYIGATVVRALNQQKGNKVVIVDDLSFGKQSRVEGTQVYQFDLARPDARRELNKIFYEHEIRFVIHFAARKQVGESVKSPEFYYQQNIGGFVNLLEAMKSSQVNQLVFSSSAAVYGMPEVTGLITESTPKKPINPYGETKLITEWMCKDAETAWGLKYVALRYFNAAGAAANDLGDDYALNLIPIVFKKLQENLRPIVFGHDYNTPDGTCVRDYIHVTDLADAHIKALKYLAFNGEHHAFNVGTGKGSSVMEVLHAIHDVTQIDFDPRLAARRPGDPDILVASNDLIRQEMDWQPKYDLRDIVQSAWDARAH
ncbi:MAG: UDP-glucose 4-epimerase GalE [Bifidobacteriaceae bacterium]|jgi:UDP-glucose 4-epimerase|nr:UDP-glucose 4-epimerase GalE [Bifidobacteriaceae bacterium]